MAGEVPLWPAAFNNRYNSRIFADPNPSSLFTIIFKAWVEMEKRQATALTVLKVQARILAATD